MSRYGEQTEAAGRSRYVFLSVVLAVASGAVVGGYMGYGKGLGDRSFAPRMDRDLIEAQAESVLGELRAAWRPEHRARVLEDAVNATPRVVSVLYAVLLLGEQTVWMDPAIEYAVASKRPELRPALETLAQNQLVSSATKVRALRAAHQLAPWGEDTLRQWLEGGDERIRALGLELALERDDDLAIESLLMLDHRDPMLREAVVTALKRAPKDVIVPALWRRAKLGGDESACAMQAMSVVGFHAAVEVEVLERLSWMPSKARWWALEFLADKGEPLADANALWALAKDTSAPSALRARGVLCLEQTGSFDPARADDLMFYLDPLGRHFVGRCLLGQGDTRGIDVLCELVGDREFDPNRLIEEARLDVDVPDDVHTESLRLLAWLGGSSPTAEMEVLRDAARGRMERARHLPRTQLLASPAKPAQPDGDEPEHPGA